MKETRWDTGSRKSRMGRGPAFLLGWHRGTYSLLGCQQVERDGCPSAGRRQAVTFKVPPLVSEQLWQKANAGITERGRGKGKQGQSIKALLRNRIYCPRCGRPMVVRRHARQQRIYYYCSKYYRPWAENPCGYNRFAPGSWDDLVWDCVYALLENDVWLEQQLASEQSQDENMAKLLKLHRYKISQAQSKIARVQEGFEGGIYSLDEAKQRIAECEVAIAKAEQEAKRLQTGMNRSDAGAADIEAVKHQLKAFRERNLEDASFEDKLDMIAKLGIRVYPSEDLKTMRVTCGLNLQFEDDGEDESAVECRKVMFGSPHRIKDRTFSACFELPWAHKKPKPRHGYYPNPLVIAQSWHQRLETGQAATKAELARQLGVSRSHVTQVLRLLNLSPEVKESILSLGDPIEGRVLGQHTLRSFIRLPNNEQRAKTLELIARNRRQATP